MGVSGDLLIEYEVLIFIGGFLYAFMAARTGIKLGASS